MSISMETFFIWGVFAYLIGAIPTGYILVKLFLKEDVRQQGSGNIGATNVLRTGGKKLGLLTYLLDIVKTLVPIILFDCIMNPINDMQADVLLSSLIIIGGLGVFGHMYSCWLKFSGGKGVASFTALCAWLFPYGALMGGVAFIIVVFATRTVSLSSLIGVSVASAYVIMTGFPALDMPSPFMWVPKTFFVFIVILIFWRHKNNVSRLLRGEENKIRL